MAFTLTTRRSAVTAGVFAAGLFPAVCACGSSGSSSTGYSGYSSHSGS
jgi:hypothetical protein